MLSYKILDTPEEQELNDIAQIASAVCGADVAMVSFIDQDRQWFKAKFNYGQDSTPRALSLCQYTLDKPDEVLVVEDATMDSRFSSNPFVASGPGLRFYASAPLVSEQGNVLGTLCAFGQKPTKMSKVQEQALRNLANQVMKYIEARKIIQLQKDRIDLNLKKLNKLTDQAPGVIFQLEMSQSGELSFPFMSEGISKLHPGLNRENIRANPRLAFSVIHPEDQPLVRQSLKHAMQTQGNWYMEYRVVHQDGSISWHVGKAVTEAGENGSLICYGTFQDISNYKSYQETLEKIAFDISHVLRKPVTTMLGLTAMINSEDDLKSMDLQEYLGYIRTVSEELDSFTRQLNTVYMEKRNLFKGEAI